MDVLGIIGVAAGGVAIPLASASTATSVIGISQSANAQQQQAGGGGGGGGGGQGAPDPATDPRLAKFNIVAYCDEDSPLRKEVNRTAVVLYKNKLWLDAWDPANRKLPTAHPFSGFYLDYPSPTKPLGLVSTISHDPPELNWIYADAHTGEVRYGNKTASVRHVHGPWDWTEDRVGVVLEGEEGMWVAVEEGRGRWALFFDLEGEGERMGEGVGRGRRALRVSLERRVVRAKK